MSTQDPMKRWRGRASPPWISRDPEALVDEIEELKAVIEHLRRSYDQAIAGERSLDSGEESCARSVRRSALEATVEACGVAASRIVWTKKRAFPQMGALLEAWRAARWVIADRLATRT